VDRRAFVAGTLSLLAAPLAAGALQAGKKLPRIAFVFAGTPVAQMQGSEPVA
jgi:hypothetical protein